MIVPGIPFYGKKPETQKQNHILSSPQGSYQTRISRFTRNSDGLPEDVNSTQTGQQRGDLVTILNIQGVKQLLQSSGFLSSGRDFLQQTLRLAQVDLVDSLVGVIHDLKRGEAQKRLSRLPRVLVPSSNFETERPAKNGKASRVSIDTPLDPFKVILRVGFSRLCWAPKSHCAQSIRRTSRRSNTSKPPAPFTGEAGATGGSVGSGGPSRWARTWLFLGNHPDISALPST